MQDADNYYAQALSMLVQVSPLCPNFHFFALYKKRSFKWLAAILQELKWIKLIPSDSIGKMASNVITTVAKVPFIFFILIILDYIQ